MGMKRMRIHKGFLYGGMKLRHGWILTECFSLPDALPLRELLQLFIPMYPCHLHCLKVFSIRIKYIGRAIGWL